MTSLRPPAVNPETIEQRVGTGYPQPYQAEVKLGRRRSLGEVIGLTRFGVNLTELPPGAWSSQRHWHTHEDEFIYVVEGELTLVTDWGEQTLTAGMVAGFPAGAADGHHLVNRSDQTAVYLEVGDRSDHDEVYYPDIDMVYRRLDDGSHAFTTREGEPY